MENLPEYPDQRSTQQYVNCVRCGGWFDAADGAFIVNDYDVLTGRNIVVCVECNKKQEEEAEDKDAD